MPKKAKARVRKSKWMRLRVQDYHEWQNHWVQVRTYAKDIKINALGEISFTLVFKKKLRWDGTGIAKQVEYVMKIGCVIVDIDCQ